jgi:hypothetical protein
LTISVRELLNSPAKKWAIITAHTLKDINANRLQYQSQRNERWGSRDGHAFLAAEAAHSENINRSKRRYSIASMRFK